MLRQVEWFCVGVLLVIAFAVGLDGGTDFSNETIEASASAPTIPGVTLALVRGRQSPASAKGAADDEACTACRASDPVQPTDFTVLPMLAPPPSGKIQRTLIEVRGGRMPPVNPVVAGTTDGAADVCGLLAHAATSVDALVAAHRRASARGAQHTGPPLHLRRAARLDRAFAAAGASAILEHRHA